MKASEVTVQVRRHPQDWQTATYRLQDIDGLHWGSQSGGVGRTTGKPALFGYAWCNGMLSGMVAHSCSHGPPPHRILICLPRVVNKDLWSLLLKQVPKIYASGADKPSGEVVAAALAQRLEARAAQKNASMRRPPEEAMEAKPD